MNSADIENEVGWCVAVIRNAGSNARKKFKRWQNDVLTNDDFMGTTPHDEKSFSNVEWHAVLELLSKRERYIIYQSYFLNKPQCDIAREMKMSQQHVSRLRASGIQKLRSEFKEE